MKKDIKSIAKELISWAGKTEIKNISLEKEKIDKSLNDLFKNLSHYRAHQAREEYIISLEKDIEKLKNLEQEMQR